ncbi:hypothetical protein M3Y96_00976700 [Aphelenchoides besseyi]|nr:hypothetical protein M3Y96_00976700 [Aphelenchoides besseyi]
MSTIQFQKSTANRTFNNGPYCNDYQRAGNTNTRNNPGLATSRRQDNGVFIGTGNRFGLSKEQPRCPQRFTLSAYRINLEASLAREPAKWLAAEPLVAPYVEPHVATTSARQDFREVMWQQHLEGIGNDFVLNIDNVPICLSKAVLASGSSFFASILNCDATQYNASGVKIEALNKVIEWMYRGQLDDYTDAEVYKIACQLGCSLLIDQFVYTFGQELHAGNATEYALLAIESQDPKLRNVVQKFMATSYDHLISIFQSPAYIQVAYQREQQFIDLTNFIQDVRELLR